MNAIVMFACVGLSGVAGEGTYEGPAAGYAAYTSWLDWARTPEGVRAGLASSYSRDGGHKDYSYYESPKGQQTEEVLATAKTIQGPGLITRFWMPHQTADQVFLVRMFFDGEAVPRVETTSDIVLGGNFAYFDWPMVDTCAGGQYSYEPIPFAESLRIETINHELPKGFSLHNHYYQYDYVTLPPGAQIESFSGALSQDQQAARAAAVALFENTGNHPAGADADAVQLAFGATEIDAESSLTLLSLDDQGVIRRLYLGMDDATDEALDALHLVVSYEDQGEPAIDVPVSLFFGAGHEHAPYKSLPLGTDSPEGFYSYWPMPFRRHASISLHNTSPSPIAIDSASVEYVRWRVDAGLGYLNARVSQSVVIPEEDFHPMLTTAGRGHYVGNLLYITEHSNSRKFLEGDNIITVDETETLFGTGLEDAYNGGYYYNWVVDHPDEPEGTEPAHAVRALSGILHVNLEIGQPEFRATQYRWQIADRVAFDSSIDVRVESNRATAGAEWTSVAFYYLLPAALPGDTNLDGDLDLHDFAALANCLAQAEPECIAQFDLDENGFLDLSDLAAFTMTLTGPW